MQDLLLAYRVFARTAELKSFHRAAESLGLSNTYVSTLVRQLETQLGSRLLARTTRSVQLTSDGQLFYPRCVELLAELDQLNQLLVPQQGELSGKLRIDLPTGIARLLILPALPAALAAQPRLQLDISCTDRKVDLVAEGFDLVLRIGSVDSEGLVAKQLGVAALTLAASPAYLARFGTPSQLADLAGHQQVHYVRHFGAQDPGLAYLQADHAKIGQSTNAQLQYFPLPGAVTVNHTDSYETACLQGLGLIQAPKFGLQHYFSSGALVEVLPDLPQPAMPVWLLYPHRRHLTPRLHWALQWLQNLITPLLQQP
ncbi:MAG: LysR family transcriptional regulator [Rheinheimera sp.]|nr:LysR family transcriptional regulator [Rheinheimera sp.]